MGGKRCKKRRTNTPLEGHFIWTTVQVKEPVVEPRIPSLSQPVTNRDVSSGPALGFRNPKPLRFPPPMTSAELW